MSDEPVWRWNVDDIWLSFSSAFQECCLALSAANDVEKYHHLSASLLFGECSLESFLNRHMRNYMEHAGEPEKKIYNKLRYKAIREKAEKWPSKINSRPIEVSDLETIFSFLDLRNEVTHRKRRDHSLYKELDNASINTFMDALQRAFVTVYSGIRKPYPYWLLGWNFVGMNGDDTHPCLLNNVQFMQALNRMGFDVPPFEYHAVEEWEQRYMTNVPGFEQLQTEIYSRAPNIEPSATPSISGLRLCKRWWDKALIQSV